MDVPEARRLRTLEDENAKLKRMLADAMLDNVAFDGSAGKEMVTPAAECKAIAHIVECHAMRAQDHHIHREARMAHIGQE